MKPKGYSRLQIRLHWVVALLITLQYLLHDGISDAFDAGIDSGTLTLTPAATGHMTVGALILLLAFWRLALRQERGVPPPPPHDPPWQKMAARLSHAGIYALLLLLPLTGAIAWGSASKGAGDLHEALRAILLFLIALHAGAALYGQFVQKSGILHRITRAES